MKHNADGSILASSMSDDWMAMGRLHEKGLAGDKEAMAEWERLVKQDEDDGPLLNEEEAWDAYSEFHPEEPDHRK